MGPRSLFRWVLCTKLHPTQPRGQNRPPFLGGRRCLIHGTSADLVARGERQDGGGVSPTRWSDPHARTQESWATDEAMLTSGRTFQNVCCKGQLFLPCCCAWPPALCDSAHVASESASQDTFVQNTKDSDLSLEMFKRGVDALTFKSKGKPRAPSVAPFCGRGPAATSPEHRPGCLLPSVAAQPLSGHGGAGVCWSQRGGPHRPHCVRKAGAPAG